MDRFSGLLTAFLAITVFSVKGQIINTPCTTSMIASFTPCVNYLTGSSANGGSPTADCCKAVESLMSTSMQCTCLIVTGNVPFSLPSTINQALAIRLPRVCNSQSVPVQCKTTGVPLPPAGPALFLPPPPRALPPAADTPELPPSPNAELAVAPTASETSPDDEPESDSHKSSPVTPGASAPTAQHGSKASSGIKPVFTPSSGSNRLHCSPLVALLMLAAITVTSFREAFIF
ncbi:non-specific lipid transfer protein GPI-anchored 16-like isoform X1 [Bidens hawaiensis]|uniref:non-specific lipid transfer protein GPI-anchored 16-like isoform X1 n=1 Tax=Bidens hawaiensis TaxID=980011 RepID=UPI00404B174B